MSVSLYELLFKLQILYRGTKIIIRMKLFVNFNILVELNHHRSSLAMETTNRQQQSNNNTNNNNISI